MQEQEKLAEAERRIKRARRIQDECLDLGDLALSELPASLGNLPHLKALYLGSSFEEPSEFTDLAPLAGLQGLQRLDLRFCKGVTDMEPLAGLQGLQSLDLSDTRVTDLEPLAGLKGLQSLDLSDTRVTDLEPLAGLQGLQSLDLLSTDVTDLESLAELQGLQRLDLQYCQGVTDLEPLAGLKGLQSLDLRYTGVTDLEPLAELQGLQSLKLSNTRVTNLAPLTGLQGLQELDLYGCRPAVPEELLRGFASHPCLTKLVADEAVGVPREVLSHDYDDNCLPRLRTHFSELKLGAEVENEVKVIQSTEKPPRININPQPLTPSEKRREIFISYAWGDETPEGKRRGEVVDILYAALTADGFLPVRDRDQIRPRELISAFIRRLTRADLVVAVISDKYLHSAYCMSEIHGLWQKSQEDPDLMAQRLVPVVLPELQIARPRDRAPYVRYWREQKEELEELLRELGPDLDPETFRELRLIRSFAQDVDGILRFVQDVLMPNKLEAQLDDGFQAVRDALRRRMESSSR